MANSAQSRKRARQADRNRVRNTAQRSYMRTTVKNVIKAIGAGDKETATTALKLSSAVLDKSSRKGLIHANKVARIKSRLNKRIRAL